MAHENTLTIPMGDRWINVPGVFEGRPLTDDEAINLVRQGKLQSVDGKDFDSSIAAIVAARRRSAKSTELSQEQRLIPGEVAKRGF